MLALYRETLTDANGNVRQGFAVSLKDAQGNVVPMWADEQGLLPVAQVTSGADGLVQWYCEPGLYVVTFTKVGVASVTKAILVAAGGVPISTGQNRTAIAQAIVDLIAAQAFPTSKDYGRGRMLKANAGVSIVGNLRMSTWAGVEGPGMLGAAVWQMPHGTTEDAAMFIMQPDSDQSAGIGSQSTFRGMSFDGMRSTANTNPATGVAYREHWIYAGDLTGDKDDAPWLVDVLAANFSGHGLYVGEYHNQLRIDNAKIIACGGWGVYVRKNSDSKITRIGVGRSLQGQVYLENAASPNFSIFDIWNPSGFQGLYALWLKSCTRPTFHQGQISGMVRIDGDNFTDNAKTQYQDAAITFDAVNFKVDDKTYTGTQYVGGGGTQQYSALIQICGADGVYLSNGTFGYDRGDPTPTELLATPDYCIEFITPAGKDPSLAGSCRVSSMAFIHQRYVPGVRAARVPFKKHITNDVSRLHWVGLMPGQIVRMQDGMKADNLVKLTASPQTLNSLNYPLLYLYQNPGVNLMTDGGAGGASFTLRAQSSGLPSGEAEFAVAWP